MGTNQQPITKHHVQRAARLVGMMNARAGDSYDILEAIAEGWAFGIVHAEDPDVGTAYTTPGQTPAELAEAGETVFTADQAPPAPPTREELRLQLAFLADIKSAVETVIRWRVDDARAQYWTWEEVGEPLELSKQGAHQRYGPTDSERGANRLPWDRLTYTEP